MDDARSNRPDEPADDPRLPELFASASELEGEERARWLAELRAENAVLARQVEELLAAAAEGERRFAAPAWEGLPPVEDEVGRLPERVGPYRLQREIGRGGMGRVFLAMQEESAFRRAVALKIIDRPQAHQENVRRFRDEVRILASLEHPGIARFFDGGRAEDGTWFLALEYVEGEDLLRFVRRRGLDLRQRVALFLEVLDAVDFAHRRLVVHRDLKPANVLIGADGHAKLLDFGISRILDPDADTEVEATRTELRAFTPAYASPEQLRGERVTIATDVYSLGVMLYELLAGRRPFARGQESALRLAAPPDPEAPSTAVRTAAAPAPIDGAEAVTLVRWRDLTGDLDAITLKALRAEPDNRYASAAAFAEDLRRWLDGRPVEARRGGRRYRLAKLVRRNRLPVAFAGLAVLALVAGTVIAVAQARASAAERDRALAELQRAEATNDLTSFLLSEATPAMGRPITNAELLARGEQLVDRRFAGDPVLRVHMLLTLAERYSENQQFDRWRSTLQRAFQLSRGIGDAGLRSRAACEWATSLAEDGEQAQANAVLTEALATVASLPDADRIEALCRVRESVAARFAGDHPRAIAAAERAVALEERRPGPVGREFDALSALATAYGRERFAAADRVYRRIDALLAAQGRGHTRDAAVVLNNWSAMLQNAGQILDAIPLSERAVTIAREQDTDGGASLTQLRTLGSALTIAGRSEQAVPVLEEALAKARAAGSARRLFDVLGAASSAYREAGDLDQAAAALQEAEALLAADAESTPRQVAVLERNQARLTLARGDAARAVALAQQGLARYEAASPPQERLLAMLALAEAYNEHGEFDAGLTMAQDALRIADERRGDMASSYNSGQARLEVGVALAGRGDLAGARAELQRAASALQTCVGPAGPATRRALAQLQRLD